MEYAAEIQPLFNRELRNGNYYYTLIDHTTKLKTRRDLVQRVPVLLRERRLLTDQEYTDIGYLHMGDEIHLVEHGNVAIPVARHMSARFIEEKGFGPEICELRRLVSDKNYQTFLVAEGKTKASGACSNGKFEHGATVQPGQQPIKWGPIAQTGDARVVEVTTRMSKLASQLIPLAFGSLDTSAAMRDRNWHASASFTFGHETNREITNLQLNISPPDDDLQSSIGDAGGLHIDGNDWKGGYTCLISLSTLGNDYFPGRMPITNLKISCTMEVGSVLIFKGVYPHYPLGAGLYSKDVNRALRHKNTSSIYSMPLPVGTPMKRIMAVGYPKRDLMDFKENYHRVPEEFREEKLLSVHGTMRNKQEWLMRVDIVMNVNWIAEHGCEEHSNDPLAHKCHKSPDFWVNQFKWTETVDSITTMHYPRRSIAVKTLHFAGTTDPQLENLLEIFDTLSSGWIFPRDQGAPKKSNKTGVVVWTHTNYVAKYNPASDTIPGKIDSALDRAGRILARIQSHIPILEPGSSMERNVISCVRSLRTDRDSDLFTVWRKTVNGMPRAAREVASKLGWTASGNGKKLTFQSNEARKRHNLKNLEELGGTGIKGWTNADVQRALTIMASEIYYTVYRRRIYRGSSISAKRKSSTMDPKTIIGKKIKVGSSKRLEERKSISPPIETLVDEVRDTAIRRHRSRVSFIMPIDEDVQIIDQLRGTAIRRQRTKVSLLIPLNNITIADAA